MKIGLIGCGNIGNGIVNGIKEGKVSLDIISLFDKEFKKAENLAQKISPHPKVSVDIKDFLEGLDLVIEAASQEAVRSYAFKILNKGKALLMLSVGALEDENLWKKLKKISEKKGGKIYLPSGAILGIDGLKAGKMGKINSVILTTRKNPRSLEGLKDIKKEKIIYEGSAKEAVKKFSKNINIAATLSLTGIGFKKTKVKIIADPKVQKNIHEVLVKGDFGEFQIKTQNKPSLNNPKTSYLTILSVLTTLKKLSQREEKGGVEIGN